MELKDKLKIARDVCFLLFMYISLMSVGMLICVGNTPSVLANALIMAVFFPIVTTVCVALIYIMAELTRRIKKGEK